MTTYVGQIRGNDGIYDVKVTPVHEPSSPSKVKIQYRKSARESETGLSEGSRFVDESDDFERGSKGGIWKTADLVPNGTGKNKLEQKIRNFLNSTMK